jgi:hypothetical protein
VHPKLEEATANDELASGGATAAKRRKTPLRRFSSDVEQDIQTALSEPRNRLQRFVQISRQELVILKCKTHLQHDRVSLFDRALRPRMEREHGLKTSSNARNREAECSTKLVE